MINITSLSFQYPKSSQPVFEDVNLTIEPGTLTLVTGATGSGKSTLLRCINGLVPHFSGGAISGDIQVFNLNPIKQGPEAMASHVGFVFQEPEAQFVFDIVEDEIAFALENAGMPREQMQTRVDETIHRLHLEEIRYKSIHEISGGEKQKVAIAGALVSQPKVLILDEPTSQLDPVAADDLLTYITQLKEDLQLTALISEHRLERLLPFTDTITHLTHGKVLFGTPREILPKMEQVPPIIQIARLLDLSPLPLRIEDFPEVKITAQQASKEPDRAALSLDSEYPLEVIDLSTQFNGRSILSNINLRLKNGEILALMGLNGVGKTTFLRSVLGLTPASGKKLFYGKDTAEMEWAEIIHIIAYFPQSSNDLLFAESVREELEVTLRNHNLKASESDISAFLTQFGLDQMINRYPRDLSTGERQRVALAAITIHNPGIIFLDEPTRGLDYYTKINLASVLDQWRNAGKAILLVTHDVEFAAGIADRAVILERGKVHFNGSPLKAFRNFPAYQTQTARLFPEANWITPKDILGSR